MPVAPLAATLAVQTLATMALFSLPAIAPAVAASLHVNGALVGTFVATAYGTGICTTGCVFAPYCGDGRVQTQYGEQCDGTTSCDSSCKTLIPK